MNGIAPCSRQVFCSAGRVSSTWMLAPPFAVTCPVRVGDRQSVEPSFVVTGLSPTGPSRVPCQRQPLFSRYGRRAAAKVSSPRTRSMQQEGERNTRANPSRGPSQTLHLQPPVSMPSDLRVGCGDYKRRSADARRRGFLAGKEPRARAGKRALPQGVFSVAPDGPRMVPSNQPFPRRIKMLTKTRATIIALVASAGFATAAVAPAVSSAQKIDSGTHAATCEVRRLTYELWMNSRKTRSPTGSMTSPPSTPNRRRPQRTPQARKAAAGPRPRWPTSSRCPSRSPSRLRASRRRARSESAATHPADVGRAGGPAPIDYRQGRMQIPALQEETYARFRDHQSVGDRGLGRRASPGIEGRFGRKHLDSRDLGISHFRYDANVRSPMAHGHREQEEAYIVVAGSGRVLLDDECVDLRQWDVVRVAPEVVRASRPARTGWRSSPSAAPSRRTATA